MRKIIILSLFAFTSLVLFAYDKDNSTNDFYDNQPAVQLKQNPIRIFGEVENPGMEVDFSKLRKRSVSAKEVVIKDDKCYFVGSYKYSGYSLYDIINSVKIKRKDASFTSPVDLYIKIENEKGGVIVVSWGEVYYPESPYKNIIATEVSPILPIHPAFLNVRWPMPENMKVVIGTDIITERNISNPTKITIQPVFISEQDKNCFKKGFSDSIKLTENNKDITVIRNFPEKYKEYSYPTVFFGRGRAFHGFTTFTGIPFKYALTDYFKVNKENIMNGLFTFIAADGYRAAFSFSEIFNINNHADVLFINSPDDSTGGKFKLFPANDFFSDRAVKCISEIRFLNEK